jgi:hypothetical protein
MSEVKRIYPDSETFLNHFYGEKVIVLTLLNDEVVGFDSTLNLTTKDLAYMKEVFELFIHDKIRSGE